MSVNPPDPTEYEGYDNDVANARNTLLEFIGNCAPLTYRATILAARSPLALKLLVVASLFPLRDEDFTPVERATAVGECHRVPGAEHTLAELLHLVEEGASPEVVVAAGPHPDNNTLPYREHVADAHARRDVLRVDFERLAKDFTDEVTDWAGFTDEHDTRGCFTCLAGTCMVGYEDDLDDEEDDEPVPDPEAVERQYAHEHGTQESATE